ncbi:hypothetical protein L3X38_003883 [Prunus dulcis]|uniref:Integrase catalytic domain-containing protein n=1 Tax=Prunus dulcis TaxID=3755 RepID=A0AAD4ZMV9_PRUDU|nr:hypothetical protein L3X38_003883 [Prunus dulcis]
MIELRKLRVGLDTDNQEALLATFQVRPVLVERILVAQSQDPLSCTLRADVENGDRTDCSVRNDGALREIMDRLNKSAYFLPVRAKYSLNKLAKIFTDEIVRLHGVPVSIVSNRDPRFTSRFWTKLNEAFGTQLQFSTAFHPQTDGQSERTIQTLEGMLGACILQFRGDWDEKIPLMEFAYNDSCQTSIEMSLFDALYGKQCRIPLYEDEVGEHSVLRFGKQGKLSPRYIGPYEIIERVGPVAYRLALPADLSRLLDVFQISMLRKYISDPSHVLEEQPVELEAEFTYVK